ncbi:QcrA and Rieske domain-containing protein [Larkinella humicola]|uniref:Rieske (2Fe-2S) protein n=1 Tax=Larkinella humicola TaxID=2607654 RepID=A0A5N1J8U5_9BACT|nr:Rieske (2Fe-2S) protein [Larkinella humicola]KAA9341101.1 Rieske (2Fe-2S) protein [Larkinella humicola]
MSSSTTIINRKTFLQTCGAACLGTIGFTSILTSCKSVYYAQLPVLKGKTIEVSRKEFDQVSKKGDVTIRPFILVEMKGQSHPIYLYRRSDTDYTAILMKCSHQGNELNAHDGYLTCPAHGSEYDATGKVTEGPAEKNLTTYRVTADAQTINIHLG